MHVIAHLGHCGCGRGVVCCKQIIVVMCVCVFFMGTIAGKLIALIFTVFFSHV